MILEAIGYGLIHSAAWLGINGCEAGLNYCSIVLFACDVAE
jgi:hypothetical protein